MKKEFICPMPIKWNEIYEILLEIREQSANKDIPKPPVPLILGAWQEPHILKIIRWKETLEWAKKYGFSNAIITRGFLALLAFILAIRHFCYALFNILF